LIPVPVSRSGRASDFELLAGRDHSVHPDLDHWHGNIGEPVALDLAAPAATDIVGFDVLNWNVAIGRAHLDELLSRLKAGAADFGERPDRPLVLLIQEAYRSDPSIPEFAFKRYHGGHVPVGTRRDIVDFAHENNLSLRYAPSMRNGKHRSDRGNAILSNVAIRSARMFVLPYIRQRRVVVKAELEGFPDITFISAHLDTGGRIADQPMLRFGAGRSAQARELARRLHEMPPNQSFVLGADLNSAIGLRDPALRVLMDEGLRHADGSHLLRHTFHGPVKLLLDHLLIRSAGRIRDASVIRIDELPGDRTSRIFGSDHHPLLARIELAR